MVLITMFSTIDTGRCTKLEGLYEHDEEMSLN